MLGAGYLIPFKIKAWLDLSDKWQTGLKIHSNDIKKHKNDVFRLSQLLVERAKNRMWNKYRK